MKCNHHPVQWHCIGALRCACQGAGASGHEHVGIKPFTTSEGNFDLAVSDSRYKTGRSRDRETKQPATHCKHQCPRKGTPVYAAKNQGHHIMLIELITPAVW
jgi:hypothetical protein